MENKPVKDWDLFEKVCKEQANGRIRDPRGEIIRIHDVEALATLSDAALQQQAALATKLSGVEAEQQIARLMAVRVLPVGQETPDGDDAHEEREAEWKPTWT